MKKFYFLAVVLTLVLRLNVQADSVVVFNEVMYHPAGSEPVSEWIELRNQLAVDVDISGWSLQGAIQYTFPSNSIARGRGMVLVGISPATLSSVSGETNVFGPFTGRLGNNGDHVELRNNSGRLMDQLDYGTEGDWPVAPDGSGVSLAKLDRDGASQPPENWGPSEQLGGTPGTENFPKSLGFIPPAGLVSYWNFNELGTTALDQAGQNHGTLGSAVTRSSGAGIGGGMTFGSSSNAYVNAGPGAGNSFSVSSGITIEAVLQPGWSGSNSAAIFSRAPRRPGAYRDTVLANSPVAYWRMDDTTTTIMDSTANAHHGTAMSGVVLNQAGLIPSDPASKAVGLTALQRITVNGFEKIGPGGYTVEFWVRPDQLPTTCCQNLVGDGESASDFFMMTYILGPNQGLVGAVRPHFSYSNSPVSLDSSSALQVGRTYHVAATWDATSSANNAVIYINGVADRIATATQVVPAAGTTGNNRVYIGKDDRDTSEGNNTIDEVALYNYALSADTVASHYLAATTTNFDLNLGNAISLSLQNDGNNAAANPPVAPGPVLSFGLVVGGVYSELDMPLDGQAGRPTLAALEDGQLHHVAAAYDSATGLKGIYVDGVLCFSTTLSGTVNANNGANAVLGNAEVNGNAPFIGLLDEMAYWNRALSASEVAEHTAALQAGRDYFSPPPEVLPPSVVFNEISSSTNSEFWLELINWGTNLVTLDGVAIFHDGAIDSQYLFPSSGLSLAPGATLALTNTTLGFHPQSGDKLYLTAMSGTKVLDSVVVKRTARGRHPDGTGAWLRVSAGTPGGANEFVFHDEIVINEIMYHHALLPGISNAPPQESPEAWVELFNKSSNTVDLTGWQITGGISYLFTPGQKISGGGYLVVADDSAYLRTLYPGVEIVGDFGGRLSGKSDVIRLDDPTGNPADEVRYFDGGRWPGYADAGGSSLELRDPNADNSKAEAWAASTESGKTGWQSYSYRMLANIPSGSAQPSVWNDFILGLLDGGECLIDDLSVIESPTNNPAAMVGNGNFENGLSGWRVLGTHGHSRVEVDPENPGNHVLHLVASGPQEHMHNHIESTYLGGKSVVNGREYQISYRARWLAGNNLLNTRLYFNRCARSIALPRAELNGTPGAPNSRLQANIGPTFSQLQHRPVVPQPGQEVTVSVRAQDPQGVNSCALWWSANGGAWSNAPMASQGDGGYAGGIPAYSAGTIIQFYVRAVDGLGAPANFPAAGPDSAALYAVADGQANLPLAHNVRLILTPANANLLHAFTNVMSNELLPCTTIYDERRAYYDCSVHLRGSQRGRYSDTRTGFHIEFPPDDLFRGVQPVMLIDRSGAGDATGNKQEEIVLKHMLNRAGGIPGNYSEICRIIAPRSTHTGPAQWFPRHEDLFIEEAFENGGDGTMFELELIYYPTTADAAGYKLPQPDGVDGPDFSNLGDDKEIYRYNFMIKNHRDADDYQRFLALCKAFSLSGTALQVQAEDLLDMDQWLRAYAFVSLCSVGDMYTYGNNHNFFLYIRPSDHKVMYFPWDMDFVFTRGASGALVGDKNLGKLMIMTPNLRRLYAHMLDILDVSFNSSYMAYWTDHYDNFAPGQNYSGTLNNIAARATYVRNTINSGGGTAAFVVNGATNVTTGTNLLTFTGTAPISAQSIRVNGQEYPVTWNTVSSWSMRVPISEATNLLQFTAFDLKGNLLSNFTRSVRVVCTNAIPGPAGMIVINEIMYHPAAQEGSFVELFNTSQFAFDLSGWRFNGLAFTFPSGSFIAPWQYLVLAKDLTGYQAAYGSGAPLPLATYTGVLQNDGETLSLIKPGLTPEQDLVVDRVRYENGAPWPQGAAGEGYSLQLRDANQDNSRVSNWAGENEWRFASITGTLQTNSTNIAIWLNTAGDVYIDDLSLVPGRIPGVGENLAVNGEFEAPLAEPWYMLGTGHAGSAVTTERARSGSGSLHLVSTNNGTPNNNCLRQTIVRPSSNSIYTMSFWFVPSTNGLALTTRTLSGSTLTLTTSLRPLPSTPGTNNGIATELPEYPAVWLNEVQAENLSSIADGAGHRVPWIELYNAGTNSEPLDGLFLANNYTNLLQWAFPAGSLLLPGEFKVIFADGASNESTPTEWHANFTLPATTGSVALARVLNGKPQILDYMNYRGLRPDRSYGGYPDGQMFYRQEFFRVTPQSTNDNTAAPLVVSINEWMAANTQTLLNTNNSNRYDDWFELYNPDDSPAQLGGYYLTDNLMNPFQFMIPQGFVIPPHGFLLVWGDNQPALNNTNVAEVHASFRLDQAGEQIGLFASDGKLIDGVTFEPQFTDISQGRYPDASAAIYFLAGRTPAATNTGWANRYPVVAPVADLKVWAGQTVALPIQGSDPDSPPQTIGYSLDNGTAPGAAVDAVSGLFSWTAGLLPSTHTFTVRVTDNGSPALSATQTFRVVVINQFSVGGIAVGTGGAVSISFSAVIGKTYRTEYKTNLSEAVWKPLGTDLQATSESMVIQDSMSGEPQRFYRVLLVE